MLYTIALTSVITLVLGIIYASFFEWTLHRYVMHRPLGSFRYPYVAHALTHHMIFKADETYHYSEKRMIEMADTHGWDLQPGDTKITMAWWNGPALVAFGPLPFYCTACVLWFSGYSAVALTVVIVSMIASAGYYGAYEYLHYCMHLPKARRVEKSWLFRLINGHHVLHHRYPGQNFNVVLPLADLVLGTLLPRSKIRFPQVRGPSVPDLQPA